MLKKNVIESKYTVVYSFHKLLYIMVSSQFWVPINNTSEFFFPVQNDLTVEEG